MKYQVSDDGNTVTALISGQMTFDDRAQASAMGDELTKGSASGIILDLSQVDYMDSAGLGILLTLREKAQAKGVVIALKGASGSVKEVLELACFDTLFAFDS